MVLAGTVAGAELGRADVGDVVDAFEPALGLADGGVLQVDRCVLLEDREGHDRDDQEGHEEDAQADVVNSEAAAGVLPGAPRASETQQHQKDAEGDGHSHDGFLGVLDAGDHDVVLADGDGADDADDSEQEHQEGWEFHAVADELER